MNHLHITATDVAESQAFYEGFFGYRKKFSHGEGIFLVNDSDFLLAIDPSDERAEFPSWFHMGFCLDRPELVRDLFARMQTQGVQFARELKEFGEDAVNFYCYDPGGFKIEVSWNREDTA